jgi:hypothetical protein
VFRLTVWVFLLLAASRGSARADEAPSVAATADALFREGRKAMRRGDFAEAVLRLAESQRLAPAAGTLVSLAVAEEKTGNLTSAWEHARAAMEALPSSDDRYAIAAELFASLDERLPRLVLHGSTLPPGARVSLDRIEFRPASFDVPLPAQVGSHTIVVSAPGHADHVVAVMLSERRTVELTLTTGPATEARVPTPNTPVPRPTDRPSTSASWRTIGFIGVGVGVAGLVLGATTGLMASARNETVLSRCEPRGCDALGVNAAAEGRTFATVSTVGFVAGAALLVGGVVLVLVAPRARPVANLGPWASPVLRF